MIFELLTVNVVLGAAMMAGTTNRRSNNNKKDDANTPTKKIRFCYW